MIKMVGGYHKLCVVPRPGSTKEEIRRQLKLTPVGIPTARGIDWEKISKIKYAKPAKNPYATAAPTARGFSTAKRKTRSSKKTCRTCKRKK